MQYTLRLLIPPGSAILDGDEPRPWLVRFEPEQFGWSWAHPDPRVDDLWRASAALVQADADSGADPMQTFRRLRALADSRPHLESAPRPRKKAPRLTEPWFC